EWSLAKSSSDRGLTHLDAARYLLRHRMTPRRRLVAVTAAVTGLALLAAACSNTTGLPAAFYVNAVDTVSLYALRGTAITLPSAYSIQDRLTVRTDTTVSLDFEILVDLNCSYRGLALGLPKQ